MSDAVEAVDHCFSWHGRWKTVWKQIIQSSRSLSKDHSLWSSCNWSVL